MPLLGIPEKRLLVLAGVSESDMILTPLRKTQPEGLLLSYLDLVKGIKRWSALREVLDTWPHYRYLDSGVYTYISRWMTKGIPMTREEVSTAFGKYCEFLKEHHEAFSWLIDFDVDSVDVDGVPGLGVELTREHRRVLRGIVGDKLLPVWHIAAGIAAWKELIAEYRYVCIGHDRNRTDLPVFRSMIELAHRAGVKVHGLSVGSFNTMARVPYDTGDSTNWLGAVKYGKYVGGVQYSDRKVLSPTQLVKAYALEDEAREAGYDPSPDAERTAALELNIVRIKKRQEAMQWP